MPRLMKYRWANRVIPPFILATIASCVWYGWKNHTTPIVYPPPAVSNVNAVTHAAVTEIPPVNAVVTKQGSDLHFSLDTPPYKNVQRVEFYVENQFVGAAYTKPYSVSVKESDLAAGSHTVTAKIVTPNTTAAAVPATFTTPPPTPATPPVSPDTKPVIISTPAPSHVAAPTNLTATVTADGAGVNLAWDPVDGATQYQIWRDGTQVALATSQKYTDTSLSSGQTYVYQVVAVGDANNISDLSGAASVTMPAPNLPGSSPVQGQSSMSINSSLSADQTTSADTQPAS